MTRRVRLCLVGSLVLVALAGCGRGFLQTAEREPWRAEAEAACLKSGEVRESANVVRISPISGPGACGAEFPLKVAALGESNLIGFADDLRPPASIPSVGNQPRWPINGRPNPDQGYGQSYPQQRVEPPYSQPDEQQFDPQPNDAPRSPPYSAAYPSGPVARGPLGAPPTYPAPRDGAYGGAAPPYGGPPAGAPLSLYPPGVTSPDEDHEVDDSEDAGGRYGAPPATTPNYSPAPYGTPRPLPRLGPSQGLVSSIGPVALKPTATLACPIVSQLDRWITDSVQPAAQRWFGAPVVEIRQISSYSCRGMNGNSNAHISEHAFGNALDIAAFTLADGRRITVKDGWHGLAEEQGFLRDVQGAACQQFTTVLAPGSNAYHYDHIHVDLMRRASRRVICEPAAVSGEQVAARAGGRGYYASRDGYTGSIGQAHMPETHVLKTRHFITPKDNDPEDAEDN
jgi:hypothetical protein